MSQVTYSNVCIGMLGVYLLRWYCAYVLLNAMNGITEGFKNATMSDTQVNRLVLTLICS